MVHCTNLGLEVVPFLTQATLQISCLLQLHLKLAARISQFSLQVLDLSIFAAFDQCEFVSGSLDLPEQLRLLFVPRLNLRLEYFNLVLQIVHMDLHFMFKLDGAKHKNINKAIRAAKLIVSKKIERSEIRTSNLTSGDILTLMWPRTSDSSFWISFSYLLEGPRMKSRFVLWDLWLSYVSIIA